MIAALFLYIFWALLLLTNTETGTQFLISHLPHALHIEKAEGRLMDHLVLQGVSFHDPSLSFTLDHLELYWHPLALWHQQMYLQYLSLTGLHIQDTDTPSRFNPLNLPIHWKIKDLILKDLHYQRGSLHLIANSDASTHWILNFHFYDQKNSHFDAKGKFQMAFANRGSWKNPRWDGKAILQGTWDLPLLGIHLSSIHAAAETDQKGNIVYVGTAQSQGNISLTGNTYFKAHSAQTTLSLKSTHFLVLNTPEYKVITDSALQFTSTPTQMRLSGEVNIPEARLTPYEKKNATDAGAEDIVYTDEKSEKAMTLPLESEINLTLGDHVNVEYNGMKGSMTGHLTLLDAPEHPTTAKGEIALTGVFQAFKQNLALSNSRIIFTGGPVTDPLLDITATKKILPHITDSADMNSLSDAASQVTQTGEMTIGLKVQGPASHKRVSLFSSPATLSSTDVLSYLLFGVSSTQVTSNNGRFLYSATNLLNLSGGKLGNLSEKFQHFLGLDEINVSSAAGVSPLTGRMEETPTLILGKALSPRLYVSYSMGRFESVNILKVRYFLARHWILLSETNSLVNSLDLFYTIERDQ